MKNFEKFNTVKERTDACVHFLIRHKEYDNISYIEAAMTWLDLEAEEEKPLPCPFCGGEVIVSDRQVYCADETNCNYGSGRRNSRDEAIAAHNRVAKAVMEAKKEGDKK